MEGTNHVRASASRMIAVALVTMSAATPVDCVELPARIDREAHILKGAATPLAAFKTFAPRDAVPSWETIDDGPRAMRLVKFTIAGLPRLAYCGLNFVSVCGGGDAGDTYPTRPRPRLPPVALAQMGGERSAGFTFDGGHMGALRMRGIAPFEHRPDARLQTTLPRTDYETRSLIRDGRNQHCGASICNPESPGGVFPRPAPAPSAPTACRPNSPGYPSCLFGSR